MRLSLLLSVGFAAIATAAPTCGGDLCKAATLNNGTNLDLVVSGSCHPVYLMEYDAFWTEPTCECEAGLGSGGCFVVRREKVDDMDMDGKIGV